MPKESRSRMQKWPSSTLCPPNSTVTGTTHFYPVAIRSAHVTYAQALSGFRKARALQAAGTRHRLEPLLACNHPGAQGAPPPESGGELLRKLPSSVEEG